MATITRILAATDLSAPARDAALRAAMLSKRANSSLELIHVADTSSLTPLRQFLDESATEMDQRVLQIASKKLRELSDYLTGQEGIPIQTRVMTGSLLESLTEASAESDVDLLVCGAKGESFLRHAALGTTAVRLLKKAACPVLVVKQPPRAPYRRVLVPVDFSKGSLQTIYHARAVAPQASIILLNVFDVPFESKMRYAKLDTDIIERYRIAARQQALEQLQELRDTACLAPETSWTLVSYGDAATRITEQEQELDCDLVVMGKHSTNVVEEWLLGSVTKRVLDECRSDVLVCNDKLRT